MDWDEWRQRVIVSSHLVRLAPVLPIHLVLFWDTFRTTNDRMRVHPYSRVSAGFVIRCVFFCESTTIMISLCACDLNGTCVLHHQQQYSCFNVLIVEIWFIISIYLYLYLYIYIYIYIFRKGYGVYTGIKYMLDVRSSLVNWWFE